MTTKKYIAIACIVLGAAVIVVIGGWQYNQRQKKVVPEESVTAASSITKENTPTAEDLEPSKEMTPEERAQERAVVDAITSNSLMTTEHGGVFGPRVHQGAGNVKIVRDGEKRTLIFDEDFVTDAGPNLHVFLTAARDPMTSAELHAKESTDLGKLKSTSGMQTYEIPSSVAFQPASVVVYCVPFKVIFSVANLE